MTAVAPVLLLSSCGACPCSLTHVTWHLDPCNLACRFAASTGELSALTVTKKAPPSFSFGTAPRARLLLLLLHDDDRGALLSFVDGTFHG